MSNPDRQFSAMPEAHALRRVKWQLFATLTFAEQEFPEARRKRVIFAFLRKLAESDPKNYFPELLWCARWERHGLGGLGHYHLCVAGLPEPKTTPGFCREAQAMWNGLIGRFAHVRSYVDDLDGIGYALKLPNTRDELAVWREAYHTTESDEFQPMLSNALLRYLRTGR